jgi:L-seryl-tRNA(Ser) seleniumtransferase
MAKMPLDELQSRAEQAAQTLGRRVPDSTKVEATAVASVAGGGSMPGFELPSFGLAISDGEQSSAELQRRLRYSSPPVIGRVEDDRLVLDLRTVPPAQDELLLKLVIRATQG